MPESIGNEVGEDPLADAGQRLSWANKDGEDFDALSKWFRDSGAYAVRRKRNGDRWEANWHRFIEPEIEAEKFTELARLLGSFLDHSRAALNYAVYQLALRALTENPSLHGELRPESVEFPIFENPKTFKRENRIKKLPDNYRSVIESVQPYNGRNCGLWLLHELGREYRHRVIHTAQIAPSEASYRVLYNGQVISPPDLEVILHERVEHDDVLMRFSLDVGADPDPDVHPQVAVTVGIDHTLTRGLIGTSVLSQITKDGGTALDAIERLLCSP